MQNNKQQFWVITLLVVSVLFALPLKAQVNIGTLDPPQPFSILELTTTKLQGGLRLPQLKTEERNAITTAAFKANPLSKGLMIFNTTTNCVNLWDGTVWIERCTPPPTLDVNPTTLIFTSVAGGGGSQNVTVTTNQQGWSITDPASIPSWIGLTGTGTGTLTVSMPQANSTSDTRSAVLTLTTTGGALSKTLTIIQLSDNVVDNLLPVNIYPYVGAFWKANQTGERLIRIPRPTDSPATRIDGPWAATVIAGTDWIVLDTMMTTDQNVGWRTDVVPNENMVHSYENSSFDQQHPVISTLTSVGGTVSEASPQIYFRIGLRTPLQSGTTAPRYGIVLLTYSNRGNVAVQRIWIRQGEAPDYLMRKSDAINSGGFSGSGPNARPAAARFSPYNLTYSSFNTSVPYRSATFTQYPSQAGAYFQWANTTNQRFAYPPTGAATPWDGTPPSSGYWTNYSATYETAPQDYRRPTDGKTNNNVPDISTGLTQTNNNIVDSELRQSLWLNPQTSVGITNTANSIWGYYADGFFDRRALSSNPDDNSVYAKQKTAVSVGNNNIAYIGRLFFNPDPGSYASIFFPATGSRGPFDGLLTGTGVFGNYWTSSSYESSPGLVNSSWMQYFTGNYPDGSGGVKSSFATQGIYARNNGFSIRCVYDYQ